MQAARQALGDKWLVFGILMIPALGPAVVKPCVAGTTARASAENVRSIGYSIYYTIVNIGGTLGPVVAWLVRKQLGWGIESVFRVSALSVFLMFLVTLLFFREPARSGEQKVASVAHALKNMFVVLAQFPLRSVLADIFEFLHRVLAGIHLRPSVSARLRGPQRQCRSGAFDRRAGGDLLPDSRQLSDAQDPRLSGDDAGPGDLQPGVVDSGFPSRRLWDWWRH